MVRGKRRKNGGEKNQAMDNWPGSRRYGSNPLLFSLSRKKLYWKLWFLWCNLSSRDIRWQLADRELLVSKDKRWLGSQGKRLVMISKKKMHTIVFFLLAVGIAIGAGFFRTINDAERGRFSFQIQHGKKQLVTIDLAKQGIVKYYLQPGTITLYGRGKISLPDTKIRATFFGAKGFLLQGSKKSNWVELTEDMPVKSGKSGTIPLSVEVDFPYFKTRQYEVGKTVVEFWHDNQMVHSIDFRFINSKYSAQSAVDR